METQTEEKIKVGSRDVYISSDTDVYGYEFCFEYYATCPFCHKENTYIDDEETSLCSHYEYFERDYFVFRREAA